MAMAATVNVNGRITDQEHAVISVFDHGFLYGEGIYETLRTYNGQPFLFDRHMARLRTSAADLGGAPDREAYIRVLVTRGIGELTYDPAACPSASVVVTVKPHVEPP